MYLGNGEEEEEEEEEEKTILVRVEFMVRLIVNSVDC